MNNDDNGLTGYLDEQANLYHTTGQSAISDAVYDSLARTVGRVVVGAKEGNNTVKHNTPMLSLNNILTTGVCDQVETWEYTALSHWMSTVLSRLPMIRDSVWVIEPKLDGLAIRLNYVDGRLISAALRGDGVYGRDVTTVMVDSGIVPLEIDYRDALEVRGEVNCAEGVFTALNTQLRDDGLKPYSNARNAVAGWMSSASPHLAICQFTLYDAMGISDWHVRNKEVCAGLGFTTAKTLGTFKLTDTLETITDIFTQSASQRSGSMTDCLWDGLVYKLDSHIDRLAIGGNDTAPMWAIAHKYPPSEATTVVVGITFTVGIDGRITPVCQCDPVEIGGVIVSECTLHSMHRLHDLNISVGDTVSITRNGDVIPHLHSVVYRPTTRMETADYAPKRCPSCQSVLETVGKHLYCENHEQCPSQELSRHLRFVGERGFNIDELGTERLKVVLQQGVLLGEGVSGWYSDGVEDRLATALNSATVARKIISAFEVAKDKISLANYLYALYIPGCGYTLSKKLSYHVRGIQDILSMPNTQLMEITQLKEHAVIALKMQLMSSRIQEADHWMTVRGIIPKTQITTIRGSVVITGTLSQSRQAITAMLERYGYTTTTSVNQTTMAVICGAAPSMSKVNRAVKLNIPRWTESQLTEHLSTIHITE